MSFSVLSCMPATSLNRNGFNRGFEIWILHTVALRSLREEIWREISLLPCKGGGIIRPNSQLSRLLRRFHPKRPDWFPNHSNLGEIVVFCRLLLPCSSSLRHLPADWSIRRIPRQVEAPAQIAKSLYRDNSKLVVDKLLPIDWTVSWHQMCLPLIHQAEIPHHKEKCDGD
jgi:hypothetical protein